MKGLLVLAAIMAIVGLIFSITMMSYMVKTIPSTNPKEGNLFNYSVGSTLNLLLVPLILIISLAFLAFLIWLLKMKS